MRFGALTIAVLVLLGSSAISADAQTAAANEARVSIWDGVYTEAQAERGAKIRNSDCAACHGAKEWAGSFLRGWNGRSANDLFEQIRSTMPMDSPGRLTRQQYADIIAYMFSINDVPPGSKEMGGDAASLRRVLIDQREK